MDDEAMAAAKPKKNKPAKDTPRIDHGERNVLLTLALLAAAEVCALAWMGGPGADRHRNQTALGTET